MLGLKLTATLVLVLGMPLIPAAARATVVAEVEELLYS